MGCSTCSTKTADGKSAGCKNNGSCDTGGCNKLNIYNWLSNMELPSGQAPFNIIEVRFKGSRKEFYRLEPGMEVQVDDMIAVEGNPGHDIGQVSIVGELVRLQLKKRGVKENSEEIKKAYRMARPIDIEKWKEAKDAEENTMFRARTIALQLKLSMKLSDVEYQGDMKKATFFYTADERVDFRELIKRLAEEFKVRIEMRQIGMRQEASRLGGIGSCGRELCCSTWLTDFKSVTTGAARYQNLALNPLKLAGQCGKLKCCLNYELDSYLDALRDLPDTNTYLKTERGTAVHRKTDIFKRLMWYSYSNKLSTTEVAQQFKESEDWVALPVDRVKEIIGLNRKEVKPPDLLKHSDVPKEKAMGFDDVVGQDSISRMDNKSKSKKFKKRKGAPSPAQAPEAENTDSPAPAPVNRNPIQTPQAPGSSPTSKAAPTVTRPAQQPSRPPQQANKPAQQANVPRIPVSPNTEPAQRQPLPPNNPSTQTNPPAQSLPRPNPGPRVPRSPAPPSPPKTSNPETNTP